MLKLTVAEPDVRLNSLLRAGRYLEAWPLYEARASRRRVPLYETTMPEWRGERLDGQIILVWGEQGIGDEVQFSRFVPRLRGLGAERIVVGALPQNQRLFAQLGADEVMDRTRNNEVLGHVWTGLLSLPYRLGIFEEDAFGAEPYLRAPNPRVTGGIGVIWRGEPKHPNDANRSMTSPEMLLSLPGARELHPIGDALDSLDQLSGLDGLVSVDTSWAHMAGAIGLPCAVLLPFVEPDWRWGVGRSDSPWYGSLRLFRQTSPGDWTGLVETVRRDFVGPLRQREIRTRSMMSRPGPGASSLKPPHPGPDE